MPVTHFLQMYFGDIDALPENDGATVFAEMVNHH